MKKFLCRVSAFTLALLLLFSLQGCMIRTPQALLVRTGQKCAKVESFDATMQTKANFHFGNTIFSAWGVEQTIQSETALQVFLKEGKSKASTVSQVFGQDVKTDVYTLQNGDKTDVYTLVGSYWSHRQEDIKEEEAASKSLTSVWEIYKQNADSLVLEKERTLVGDRECYKLTGTLKGESLRLFIEAFGISQMLQEGLGQYVKELDLNSALDDSLAFTLEVDAKTFEPKRVQMDLQKLVDRMIQEALQSYGVLSGLLNVEVNSYQVTLTYQNWNQATPFTVPEVALSQKAE